MIVVAPDKFKGSLPATQVAAATRRPGCSAVSPS
jgi:glycerate kinase